MQLLENCDTDGNIDKVDWPPMLTEPTMLMKLTASPAGRTSSSVVGGDGGRGGGIRGGWPWFSCPELIPPIRACFTFACITARILYYDICKGAHERVCLYIEGGLGVIRVYVYVAGRRAGLVMSYNLVSPHYTTTKAKSGGRERSLRRWRNTVEETS